MKIPTLFSILLLLCVSANSQDVNSQLQPHHDNSDCLIEASQRLPEFYKYNHFDSMQAFLNGQRASCGNRLYIFAAQILLDIQLNHFSSSCLPDSALLEKLLEYTQVIHDINTADNQKLWYLSTENFDASQYTRRVFTLTYYWAKDLLETKGLDSTETVLCNVFAGDMFNRLKTVKGSFQYKFLDSLAVRNFNKFRNSFKGSGSFSVGWWVPQGKLAVLGSHPSIGFQFGLRNKWNEATINFTGRFIKTANNYTVLRQDSLYSRSYYFGGYIGLDYTRYVIHSTHFETGVTVGIGYDSFDIAMQAEDDDGNVDHTNDYLKPFGIGSFNINAGVRANYFFNASHYLGLEAKFNRINYHNKGGTPLDGNAFSIAIIWGGNF